MNKIKFFAGALVASAIIIGASLLTGCAATALATRPVTTHVVQVAGKGIKGGIVEDPVTGQYSLGYESILVTVTTVPVSISQDTNGAISYIEPDVVASFEVAGKNGIFGSAGSTYTVATGKSATQTLLGGNHPPINGGMYGTNNTIVYTTPTAVSSPAPGAPITPPIPK